MIIVNRLQSNMVASVDYKPNRQTSGESASLPQYDEGTESAEVATSDYRPLL